MAWSLILFLLIERTLNSNDPLLSIAIVIVKFKDLRVCYQSLVRLTAFLVKDAEIEPDLAHLGIQSRCLYYIFEGICVITRVVIKYGEGGPIYSFSRVFIGSLLKVFECIFIILKSHKTSSKNIERVSLGFTFLLGFTDVFNGKMHVSLEEIGPSKVLIYFVVTLIMA